MHAEESGGGERGKNANNVTESNFLIREGK
jgi:hypothetical protein